MRGIGYIWGHASFDGGGGGEGGDGDGDGGGGIGDGGGGDGGGSGGGNGGGSGATQSIYAAPIIQPDETELGQRAGWTT